MRMSMSGSLAFRVGVPVMKNKLYISPRLIS